ncbi:hypothetical protein [Scleromatobacter humisilvae]|uniref:Uncharacterized protein n=1 Tax=Scleromatobacter humisilvae TaxID=2897159 RepID=A0A9X1YNN4_9BURK|nr:hypothetical protein [Scleromatobacter humisilvae]MCK9688285.1 hypothetical protein [Scleromatobacter humisilvae]
MARGWHAGAPRKRPTIRIRERVQADARLGRGLLHLPDAAPPELPDAHVREAGDLAQLLPASPIALMGHWTRPDDDPPDDGARQYLAGNSHLVQFEQGGRIADDELSAERVTSFIEMPWREPLP